MKREKSGRLTAVAHIEKYALSRQQAAQQTIAHVCRMSNVSVEYCQQILAKIRLLAHVALHFHPDRLDGRGRSVAEGLLEDGRYASQFETHLSNGMLSPTLGGARDQWENQLFGNAYQSLEDRPKYGALDLMRHSNGPAPRFGSCYLLLKPSILPRCTFSYMDSHQNPAEKGTIDLFEDVLAALLVESFQREYALGCNEMPPYRLLRFLDNVLEEAQAERVFTVVSRNLDHYIEAQVHGAISLKEDVAYLVADPSFQGTDVGNHLNAVCEKYSLELLWHLGYGLEATAVPDNFRGATMPSLAKRVAVNGRVHAYAIGVAASDLKQNPARWQDRGREASVLQELKMLWHVLVKYGA